MLASLLLFVLPVDPSSEAAPRPNVLFIAVDDLRPEISSFGVEVMQTPNLDRLAARGVRFERAYCNVPVCGASRSSLMTGIRASPKRFRKYDCYTQKDAPGAIPLNAHFKAHGYRSEAVGKIYHNRDDVLDGWDRPVHIEPRQRYMDPDNWAARVEGFKKDKNYRGVSIEHEFAADRRHPDGANAIWSAQRIGELAAADEPFFFAVGFYKPHLPFVMPEQDWRKYEPTDPVNYFVPDNLPRGAIHQFGELRRYSDIQETGKLPLEQARNLIRGYRACVSFTDRNVGRLLDALDESGEADNTIIVLWGDHGWNLGEHAMWCKHACFETSMRTPLIIVPPKSAGVPADKSADKSAGEPVARGQASQSLVEFIDIYPTLCELAGLPHPDGEHPEPKATAQLDGASLVPLLSDPQASVRDFAVGRYGFGETIKTDRYRYTEYGVIGGEMVGNMLFDHVDDPGELVNLVDRDDLQPIVEQHARLLRKHRGRDR